MSNKTVVKFYNSRNDLNRGIDKMTREGWTVLNVVPQRGGKGCGGCMMALILWPLLLIGKGPEYFQVTFVKPE